MSKQIYRSGTSIGANIAESRYAQSPADFVSKLSIALKESGETEYWLKSLHGGGFLTEEEFSSIYNDNVEIGKMLTSSIKTMKMKMGLPMCTGKVLPVFLYISSTRNNMATFTFLMQRSLMLLNR